jgi:hypothetical protein
MRQALGVVMAGWLAACGGGPSASGVPGQAAPQRASNVVTAEEIQRHGGHDLAEILKILRPAWFRTSPTRVTTGAVYVDPIVLYLDGRRLGGLGQMRDIPVTAVLSVRYYSASEAQGRFGLDNLQGAIDVVTTR